MSFKRSLILILFSAAVLGAVVHAQGITVRLATFAPANSVWDRTLREMGDVWSKATGGRVKLTVYAGGTQGTESTVIRKMRPAVDQLQAALLLQPGLAEIDESANVFAMPFFFRSDAEFQAVFPKLAPVVAKRLEAKGFHVLNWGSAGWVQLFSKRELKTLADVKKAKLYTTAGDDRMVRWFQQNGFNPVALDFGDIPAQLKIPTGLIDAAPSPAYGALALMFFRDAPYMLEVRLAPLVGATVITATAWNKFSPDERAKMLEAALSMEKQVMAAALKLDADSIATMTSRGLKVTKLDPGAAAEFGNAADALHASMRGGIVPADMFDLARQERDAYRKAGGK